MPRVARFLPALLPLLLAACGGSTETGGTPAVPLPPEIGRADNRLLQGDPAGARDQLDRALAADPDLFAAHYRRGVVDLLYGEEGAVAFLRRAEELDPTHPGPPVFLGAALRTADPAASEEAFLRGVTRAAARSGYVLPDTTPEVAEAISLLDGNRPAAARRLLETAVREDGGPVLRLLLARARLGEGDARGAREELSRTLRAAPQLAAAHALDAAAAYRLRDTRGATAAADTALALDPDQPLALQVQGYLRLEDNEFRDAFRAWWRALLADPTVPEAYQALGGHLVRYDLHELGSHVLRLMDPVYRFLRTHHDWPGSDR